MKLIKVLSVILVGIFVGVIFGSCAKKKSSSSAGTSSAAASSCAAAVSAIGSIPAPQLALASLNIPSSSVSVSSGSYSTATPATQIQVNYSQLGLGNAGSQTDMSSTFVMWKACAGSKCSNNGQFVKSYNFNISNIPGLPTGLLQVSLKLCVDNLQFLSSADQSKAQNQCTSASPCYCGAVTQTQYMNNDSSLTANPKFTAAANSYQSAQQTLMNTAQSYINQANAYVSSCSSADAGTAQLQYAKNIAAYSSKEIASYTESYGNYFAQIMTPATVSGLQLAGTAPSCSSSGSTAVGTYFGTSTYMGTGTSIYMGSTSTYTAPTVASGSSSSGATSSSTGLSNTNTADQTGTSTGTGISTGEIVALGIGVAALAAGVAAAAYYGLKPSKDSALAKDGEKGKKIAADATENAKALVKDIGDIKVAVAENNPSKLSSASSSYAKDSSSYSSSANDAGSESEDPNAPQAEKAASANLTAVEKEFPVVVTQAGTQTLEARNNGVPTGHPITPAEKENVWTKFKEPIAPLFVQTTEENIVKTASGLESAPISKTPIAGTPIAAEAVGEAKEIEQPKVEGTPIKTPITPVKPTALTVPARAIITPAPTVEPRVGKFGLAGTPSCGNFSQTMQAMETQLYNQAQSVQAALSAISAIQQAQ